MIRRIFLGIIAAVGLGGAVDAATVGPSITDSAASVIYGPAIPSLVVTSFDLVATPPFDPAPEFALLIDTLGSQLVLTVEDDANPILEAVGSGFSTHSGGITAVLRTVSDTTGLFAPRLLVSLNIVNFDPAAFFSGTGELVIESAPAPIPLPAGAPLLAAGFVLLWGARKRAAA